MKFNGLMFVLAFALSACDNSSAVSVSSSQAEVGVKVLKAAPYVVQSELTGRIKAYLTAEVRPQVGGIIQQRFPLTDGRSLYYP